MAWGSRSSVNTLPGSGRPSHCLLLHWPAVLCCVPLSQVLILGMLQSTRWTQSNTSMSYPAWVPNSTATGITLTLRWICQTSDRFILAKQNEEGDKREGASALRAALQSVLACLLGYCQFIKLSMDGLISSFIHMKLHGAQPSDQLCHE